MEIKRLVWDMLNLNFLPKKNVREKHLSEIVSGVLSYI